MKNVTFSDVMFEPQYSEIESRSNVNLSCDMGKFKLDLPIISSNMKDITGPKMCVEMASKGAMGILHRFDTGDNDNGVTDFLLAKDGILRNANKECLDISNKLLLCKSLSSEQKDKLIREIRENVFLENNGEEYLKFGVSIGVKEEDKKRFVALLESGAKIFCIDVAHGHHLLVKNMIKWVRAYLYHPSCKDICLIAGNIATAQAALDLTEWGADIVKVGIGPGEVCRTRKNTGVGVPQLSALEKIRTAIPNGIIIADGGVKTTGCIAKALKYANAVMLGNFLAGTTETPGNVYQTPDDQFYKVYGGSASGERKVQNGRENSFVEGVVKMVPFKGHVKYILKQIKENLQSSLSYSGVDNLTDFRAKAILDEISGGAKSESKL